MFFSWMINENEVNNRNWKKKKNKSLLSFAPTLCLDKQKPKP